MTHAVAGSQERLSSVVRVGLGEAEAAASPFSSLESFRGCCTTPSSYRSTRHLAQRYKQLGIQESADIQFQKVERPGESIEEFLGRHADRLLECDGETASLRPIYERPGEEILRWRWMSLALPDDLVLAAATQGHARRVRVLDASLRVLEPTAHLHFHATAAIPFADIWTGLIESSVPDGVRSFPEGFSGRHEWIAWLRRAFVARRILDYWLCYGFDNLTTFLRCRPQIDYALGDLRLGRIRDYSVFTESAATRFLRHSLYQSRVAQGRNNLGKRVHQDYLGAELAFNRRCMMYLKSKVTVKRGKESRRRQRIFPELWVQMTRIRVLLFRHLVHDPACSGLDSFAERFDRLGEYIIFDDVADREVKAAMAPETELIVESLELRKSPGGVSKLRQLHKFSNRARNVGRKMCAPQNLTHHSRDCSTPRLTWTLHFVRDLPRGGDLTRKIRRHYITANKLASIFRNQPELLRSIRGLDVASRELSGPLWAVAEPLRIVRNESIRVCQDSRGVSPLRFTVHVGEDFRHLLSGLRAIHEPFWWKLLRRGDRIGHAVALGWNPHDWCSRHPEVLQPRYERMFDLAWMLEFVSGRRLHEVSGATIESARMELQNHLQRWDGDFDVPELMAVLREIGRSWLWGSIDGPHWPHCHLTARHWRLLKQILQRYGEHGDVVAVRTEGDGELLVILRDELARLLARWRTPIEINPSSNLLVGNLPHPLAQPLFSLDPFDRQEDRGLVLTLSADDPACFATSLADEFAYAWAGLVVGGGESPSYAHEWLERAARAARRAAF